MSVETQIGSLVEAANNLTNEVSGKLGEIDQKVQKATSEVRSSIQNSMTPTFYVDEVGGDNGNDGTQSSPLQTIGEAVERVPRGGYLRINMLSDLTTNWPSRDTQNGQGREAINFNCSANIDLNGNALRLKTSTDYQSGSGDRVAPGFRFRVGSYRSLNIQNGSLYLGYYDSSHSGLPFSKSPQDGIFKLNHSSIRFHNMTVDSSVMDASFVSLDGWQSSYGSLNLSSSNFLGGGVLRRGALGVNYDDIFLSTFSSTFEAEWANTENPA